MHNLNFLIFILFFLNACSQNFQQNGLSKKKLEELYSQRKNIYKLANHKVICDKLDKQNIAEKVIEIYEKY